MNGTLSFIRKNTAPLIIFLLLLFLGMSSVVKADHIPEEIAKLTASGGTVEEYTSRSAALEGQTAFVGAHYRDIVAEDDGAVYVYKWNGSEWQEDSVITASDGEERDCFGNIVDARGNVLAIRSVYDDDAGVDVGAVYIFRYDGEG